MIIRQVDTSLPDIDSALIWLQNQVLPYDPVLDPHLGHWWIAFDEDVPVAFASLKPVPSWPGAAYMARCGVLKKYRGQGLQRKLLITRQKKARALGYQRLITTTYLNS